MTLTKDDLRDSIYDQCGFSRTKSEQLVETVLEMLKKSLESGEDVLISRFGKFSVKAKRKRKGRNPATGEVMMLDPRRVVTFSCSAVLRKRIRGKQGKK